MPASKRPVRLNYQEREPHSFPVQRYILVGLCMVTMTWFALYPVLALPRWTLVVPLTTIAWAAYVVVLAVREQRR